MKIRVTLKPNAAFEVGSKHKKWEYGYIVGVVTGHHNEPCAVVQTEHNEFCKVSLQYILAAEYL